MKNLVLLLASLVFYAWGEPVYVLLMLFSTMVDYVHGRAIGFFRRRGRKNAARCFLASSVTINLAILCLFKYSDFVIRNLNALFHAQLPLWNLPLPIGISFYTFQTMSYTIDVYRGQAKIQKNLLDFAVFVTMFPQLIAGPIVKYTDVQDDLGAHRATMEDISRGCKRFIIGLAKKVLIANNIGALWESVNGMDFGSLSVLAAWLGAVAFAFQIYFDFSGYSDMAIGLGACLGFRFPENFRYPYVSRSVTEFWRRWHITLSQWFRDNVYIPLGGNRKGLAKQIRNILLVWVLTGIWHGAGWNFLLWGLWFALFLILEKMGLGNVLERLPKILGRLYAAFVVLIGWVLFAVESREGILAYLWAMFGGNGVGLLDGNALYLLGEYAVLLTAALVISTPLFFRLCQSFRESRTGYGIAVYRFAEKVVPALLLLASIAYVVEASYNPFLYFRF
jgi:alginate O-acetyltransferase complex protein AlgI